MKCNICGKKEVREDEWIDCQPGDQRTGNPGKWKRIRLCKGCWRRLNPDMWTCQRHYEALNPKTPYNKLLDMPE